MIEALLQVARIAIVANSSKVEAAQEGKTVHSFTTTAKRLAEARGVHPTEVENLGRFQKVLLRGALLPLGRRKPSRASSSRREHAKKERTATSGIPQSVSSFRKANVVPGLNVRSYMIPRQRRLVKLNQKRRLNRKPQRMGNLPDGSWHQRCYLVQQRYYASCQDPVHWGQPARHH